MRKTTDLPNDPPTCGPDDGPGTRTRQAQSAAKLREDRLKAALKANMARRKAQAKARTAGDGGTGGTGTSG